MPNHVHGLIHLLNEKDVKVDLDPGASANVGAGLRPARPVPIQTVSAIPSQNSIKQPSKPTISRHPLPEIVRAFKSFSSRRINETQGKSGIRVWQRGFYEHIIRDEDDLHRIRQYIVDNPVQWATDKYYCR